MKSLERRFNNISQLNPYWSSHTCFAEAIKDQNFSRKIISYYFNRLIERDDYDRADKKQILAHLFSISTNPQKVAEEGSF